MTEQELDRALRHALADALAEDWADLEVRPAVLSARQRRRMKALLADPAGYAKKVARPLWQRAARVAASFLLVCSLTLGAILAVSPAARAAVSRWITEVYEASILYRFHGEREEGEFPRYQITALPEGYVKVEDEVAGPGYLRISYENVEGYRIKLRYAWIEQGGAIEIGTEGVLVKDTAVNGLPAQVYISEDGTTSNGVAWADEEANIFFLIDGFEEELVLLHMAESVSLEKSTN